MNDRWRTSLWIMNADGTHDRFLADGSGAQWSPDGKRIAYVAEGKPAGDKIFVKWVDLEVRARRSRISPSRRRTSRGRPTARRSRST